MGCRNGTAPCSLSAGSPGLPETWPCWYLLCSNARAEGAEQTSEENIKRLDGICVSHYSQLGWEMPVWSSGTVLS